MGTVQGDLIQIVDRQRYLEQLVLNVYYYRYVPIAPSTNDVYPALSTWFQDNIIEPVRVVQVPGLNHFEIEIRNLSNGVDLYSEAIDIDGTDTDSGSQALPSYVTLGFKLIRESLVTRNGYKRFSGLNENNVDGNNYTFATGEREDIEAALSMDVVIGATTTFEPIIVKRPIPAAPISSYDYSSIGDAQFVGLGTQNTRKRGRGD